MTRVAKSTLALVALVAAVAAYVLVDAVLGSMPPIGFGWVTLLVVAAVDVLLAIRIRAAISDGGVGQDRSQMHPLTIARCAALGQASATGSRAAGAADLAALAASDARRGLSDHEPCVLAGRTAERNGAAVVACEVREDGTVRVAVELARAPLPAATADAVAGPPRSQAPGAASVAPPEEAPPEPSVEASAGTR